MTASSTTFPTLRGSTARHYGNVMITAVRTYSRHDLRTGYFGDKYGKNPDGLTLHKLRKNPDGITSGRWFQRLPDILGTPDHKIRLAPDYLIDDLTRLARRMERTPDDLVLVSRRHLRSNTLDAQRPSLDERAGPLHHPHAPRRCPGAESLRRHSDVQSKPAALTYRRNN